MRGWIAGLLAAWLAGIGGAQAEETTLIFATDGPTGTHVAVRVFHPWAEHINEVGKGVLHLEMGPVPNTTWATDPADAPPSVSDSALDRFGCEPAS